MNTILILILSTVSFQGPTRRFKRLCEQLQAPLLSSSGSRNFSTQVRSSPLPVVKQRSLERINDSATKIPDKPSLANTNSENSQWSFIDSDAAGDAAAAAASSISTLCSQFEASLAENDSQLDSMFSPENGTSKSTIGEKS